MMHRLVGAAWCLGVVFGLFVAADRSLAQCSPAFVPHHVPSLGGKVYAMILFDDDGDGAPSIFAAGDMFTFQGSSLGGVAKLAGGAWVRPGSGFPGQGRAMLVRDLGGGISLLIVAGSAGVQSWNGQAWAAVGGTTPGLVQSIALHDDGSGPTLYIGGVFSTVHRLVGNTWTIVAPTQRLNANRVQSLVEFDEDGPGGNPPRLFASGSSLNAQAAQCLIARYDGAGWTPVAPTGQSNWIKAMIRHDNGTGPKLYATGHPSQGQPFLFNAEIAGYNGQQWTSVITPTNSIGPAYGLVSFEEHRGQPRVLWAMNIQHLLRAPDTGATMFAAVATSAVDYSQITPLVLPPINAGPECVLFPTASGEFLKLAGCPRLSSDMTLDGTLNTADILEYLEFWFARNPRADFDHSGGLSATDIFAFLNAWFAGI